MAATKKKPKEAIPTHSNLVIGLTGPFGSGCSKMSEVLKGLNFHPFKISDDIREELKKKGKLIEKGNPGWRKVLQNHGNEQRRKNPAYWVKKVINRIDAANIEGDDIVIDGFRNFQELQEIRRIYPQFFLVAVCAERDERWKRVQSDYNGDYNEFKNDDRRDQNQDFPCGQSVQRCVDDADYVYYNNENFFVYTQGREEPDLDKIERTMKTQADDFVPLMRGVPGCRGPNPEEVQMVAAYAQSNSSTCMKRHVGAVITAKRNKKEFAISMGFNENPPNIRTCENETVCYKDEDMTSKLRAQGQSIYCPSCGTYHENLSEPWLCRKCGANFQGWLHPNRNMELCTAVHAEERAILSLSGRSASGGTLYVTTFPCFQCARLILDAEIAEVVYVEAYPVKKTSEFLKVNGVNVKPFTGFTARAFFIVFPKVS